MGAAASVIASVIPSVASDLSTCNTLGEHALASTSEEAAALEEAIALETAKLEAAASEAIALEAAALEVMACEGA